MLNVLQNVLMFCYRSKCAATALKWEDSLAIDLAQLT